MNKFAKELGFFMISVFLVSIPFLTGLRVGMVDKIDFLIFCGLILTLLEVGCLTGLFLIRDEELERAVNRNEHEDRRKHA